VRPKPGEVSYKELKEYGTKQRKKEPGGEDRQVVYNLRTHFNTWLKKLGLTPASTVGAEFTTDFKTKCEDISKEIDNKNTRKNFVPDMNRWQRYYAEMIGLHDVPGPFHEALSFLIGEKQVTLQHLSRISGVPQGLIKRWSRGEATPVVGSLGHVQSLEKALGASAGLLTEKLPKPSLRYRFRRSDLPDFLREDDCLRRKVYAHLPADFTSLEEGKQREVVDYILKEVITGGTELAKLLPELTKLPYALKEKNWPTSLTSEKERFVKFKTAMTPPIGMRRKKRCRPSSVKIIISFFEGFFGALCASPASENIKTRGLGVPPDHLSLALFVCPELVDWFFKFRFETRHGAYNSIAKTMLEHCVALVQTDFGWLRQSPELANRLRPVEGFIDESFIELAKSDWGAVCDAALKAYRIHRQTVKELVTVSRDPFRAIKGIVDSDDPMDYLMMFVEAVKANLPNPHTAPMKYASGLRNSISDRIIAITGLRIRNVVEITYRGDNSGELRKVNGKYVLEISRFRFKHPDSPFFGPENSKEDFFQELHDLDGLYKDLDEYLGKYRPLILKHFHGAAKTDILFVSTGKTIEISPKSYYAGHRERTARHMAENKARGTGVKDVRPYGPHADRHIRGTHAAKETRNMEETGNVNQQTGKMAEKSYAKYVPKDKTARVNEILFRGRKSRSAGRNPKKTSG
jgi:hypothetical protein